jgi:putative CocE/NonD family hydrolase
LLGVLLTTSCQTYIARNVLPHEGIREANHGVKIQRDIAMTTQDGVRLIAEIYHPKAAVKTPTILVRIPFSNTFKNRLGADAIGSFWASRGYTVVIQGTRGRYKSGGDFYPLIHEHDDGIDTLNWLVKQAWFNGKLGMWGGSAFGHTQWVLANQKDPAPNALMIQIASSDFQGMFYPGGAFSLESALFWAVRSYGTEDRTPDFKDLERGFNGFPLIEADNRAARDIDFFNDWVLHDQADDYWRAIDGSGRAQNLQAPVLLMAGWYDPFLATQLRDFEMIRQHASNKVAAASQLIIGPWTHADAVKFPGGSTTGDYRPASLAPSVDWFDRHLMAKGIYHKLAPVKLFVMGENKWRDEYEWPLARTQYQSYYLHSGGNANSLKGDGRLDAMLPSGSELSDHYQYDPLNPVPTSGGAMLGPRAGMALQNAIEQRADVLVYTTDKFSKEMEITGPIKLLLNVSTDVASTDFTAKLVDVYPDGRAYNISSGIIRRSYVDTKQPVLIEIELSPISTLIANEHRLRLEISSSDFPRYDRNPNTGNLIATETETRVARQTVHHGSVAPSRLILPIIPRE